MRTIREIIEKINLLRDNRNTETGELLSYINDLDSQIMAVVNPVYRDVALDISAGEESYPLPSPLGVDDIHAVYVNGRRLLPKKSLHDGWDGWYCHNSRLYFCPQDVGETAVIQYLEPCTGHCLEDIATDADLAVPPGFRELYVYHALAQIASKEGDQESYQNYKNDFNTLLSQCLMVLAKNQLYPNLAIKE